MCAKAEKPNTQGIYFCIVSSFSSTANQGKRYVPQKIEKYHPEEKNYTTFWVEMETHVFF